MKKLNHKFVEYMPETLEPDVVYISLRFRIVSHRCGCGCGNEVVTPLSPTGWELIYNGESISLNPSIGNWGFACRSHYWIVRDTVKWAAMWSDTRRRQAQEHDAVMRLRGIEVAQHHTGQHQPAPQAAKSKRGIWSAIRRLWS